MYLVTRLWLPRNIDHNTHIHQHLNGSITVTRLRSFLAGVCKCGHTWIMHFHNNNPNRPGTSCDEWECKCKQYRLRRVRRIGAPR